MTDMLPGGDGGDCFEVAYVLAASQNAIRGPLDPTWYVCHGEPIGRGRLNNGVRFAHAWVETTDVNGVPAVLDWSNGHQMTCSKDDYYRLGQIGEENVKRYSATEAVLLLALTGHYGPWHKAGMDAA